MSALYPNESRPFTTGEIPGVDISGQQQSPGIFAGLMPNDDNPFGIVGGIGTGLASGFAKLGGALAKSNPQPEFMDRGEWSTAYGFGKDAPALTDAQKFRAAGVDQISSATHDIVKKLAPDPTTTGPLYAAAHGLADMIPQAFIGSTFMGGPVGAAGLLFSENYEEGRRSAIDNNLDEKTAAKLALAGASANALGVLAPFTFGSTLIQRIGSSILTNQAFGLGTRALDHSILESAGYHDMAEQTKVVDFNNMLIDGIMGVGFGLHAHVHEIGTERARQEDFQKRSELIEALRPINGFATSDHMREMAEDRIKTLEAKAAGTESSSEYNWDTDEVEEKPGENPTITEDEQKELDWLHEHSDDIDMLSKGYGIHLIPDDIAADPDLLQAYAHELAERRAALGIPGTPEALSSHLEALDLATEQILNGKEVDVSQTGVDGQPFVERTTDPGNLARMISLFTSHLRDLGANGEASKLDSLLRELATRRGEIYPDVAPTNSDPASVTPDAANNIRNTVRDQIIDTGRHTPEDANLYAQLVEAFYSRIAERMGMQPDELWREFPLRVMGEAIAESHNQSVTLRATNKNNQRIETLARFGLDPNGSYSTRQVAAALESRQRDKYGSIALNDRSPEAIRKIADWMATEVRFELQNPEKSGAGWYSEKFQKALDAFGAEFPELLTDQNSRDLLTALIAITSDGLKVVPNFSMAADIYANYRQSGIFSTTIGHTRADSILINLAHIQRMHDPNNPEAMKDYLMAVNTVSNLKKRAAEDGIKFSSDYQAHIELPMAALVFGPKLGAFYANLMGAHGYLTMDRWWSRTFNRYRGNLITHANEGAMRNFAELIGKPDLSNDQVLSEVVGPRDALEARGFKTRLAEMVGESEPNEKASQASWMAKARELAGDKFDEMLQEHKVERSANSIYKDAFEKINDTPENATDRTFMLDAVNMAQRRLAAGRNGVDISVADIQAILWYYEKRLYGELGARQTADISYQDAATRVTQERSESAGGVRAPERSSAPGVRESESGSDTQDVPPGHDEYTGPTEQSGLNINENGTYSQHDLFGVPLSRPKRKSAKSASIEATPVVQLKTDNAVAGQFGFRTELVHESTRVLGTDIVNTPAEAAAAFATLAKSTRERFDAIVTDKDGKVLAIIGSTHGGVAHANVEPGVIAMEAHRIEGAANIWFGHNHPSGNAKLSSADRDAADGLYNLFKGSGIKARGILAIGGSDTTGDREWSHADERGDNRGITPATSPNPTGVPVVERLFTAHQPIGKAITNERDSIDVARSLVGYGHGAESGLLLMNHSLIPVGFFPMDFSNANQFRGTDQMQSVARALSMSNASHVIAIDQSNELNANRLLNLGNLLVVHDVRLIDSVNPGSGYSVANSGHFPSRFDRSFNQLSTRNAIGLYSTLRSGVQALDVKSATPERWVNLIKKLPGVKAEEVKWSGIEDWLKIQKGDVSRDEVSQYLSENGVQVDEVQRKVKPDVFSEEEENGFRSAAAARLENLFRIHWTGVDPAVPRRFRAALDKWNFSSPTTTPSDYFAAQRELEDIMRAQAWPYRMNELVERERHLAVVERRREERHRQEPDLKPLYGQYTLPGGTNYREVLLHLPNKDTSKKFGTGKLRFENESDLDNFLSGFAESSRHAENADYGAIIGESGKRDTVEFSNLDSYALRDFYLEAGYFEEAAWFSYPNEKGEWSQEIDPITAHRTQWSTELATTNETRGAYKDPHFKETNLLAHFRLTDRVDANGKKVLFVEEVQSDWATEGREFGFANSHGGLTAHQRRVSANSPVIGPFVTETKSWVNLVLKRIMVMAATEGYDRVAFINGEDSAARYSLEKHVKQIDYGKSKPSETTPFPQTFNFYAQLKTGGVIAENDVTPQRLKSLFGKEIAEKIMAAKSDKQEEWETISGEDMKTGGHGMRAFYDKILPDLTNALIKPYGQKVETDRLPIETKKNFGPPRSAEVRAFDVTEKMRQDMVENGLPLMQGKGRQAAYDPVSSTISLLKNSDASSFLHESGHHFLNILSQLAGRPNAPADIKQDMQTLLDWFGVKPKLGMDSLTTWNSMSLEEQRPGHEQFARGFEVRLREGNAPSEKLAGIFDRFKQWLLDIYKTAKKLGVELSPGVRNVYDNLFANSKDTADERQFSNGVDKMRFNEPLRKGFERLKNETGWAQVGGRQLRNESAAEVQAMNFKQTEEYKNGGSTQWIPNSSWWKDRPYGYSESETNDIIDKAARGDKLGPKANSYVNWLVDMLTAGHTSAREERFPEEDVNREVERLKGDEANAESWRKRLPEGADLETFFRERAVSNLERQSSSSASQETNAVDPMPAEQKADGAVQALGDRHDMMIPSIDGKLGLAFDEFWQSTQDAQEGERDLPLAIKAATECAARRGA